MLASAGCRRHRRQRCRTEPGGTRGRACCAAGGFAHRTCKTAHVLVGRWKSGKYLKSPRLTRSGQRPAVMPAIPNLEDICAYVDMKVLNAISEGLYSNHVGSKAQAGDEQAQAVLAQEHKVAVFVEHLLHHIQVYGRRMHSGVSLLCRSLPEAAPILRRDCAAFVGDCEVLGLRKRPCCEIKFIRPPKRHSSCTIQ